MDTLEPTDFEHEGQKVYCKYSNRPFVWMIPIEALKCYGILCYASGDPAIYHVGSYTFMRPY
ncbi:NaeI family type II restriction endonuclease [Corynebacterium sp. p3-SID1241]|uniref:NaeI family type II restriction endonuclease n=1 Tax=Corynebacterium sp. p3-SID1241 TaxID=2916102 RepID=UPI0037C06E39